MRKRILSLILCLVMLISSVPVQVFATEELLAEWEFADGSLFLGSNSVQMVSGAEYSLIEFYPEETGVYTFTGPSGSKLANFNASFFPNNITGDAASDTLEWTCTSVGQSLLLGICAAGDSVTVSIARTGNYVSHEIQYTVYENTHTPNAANKAYCAKVSGKVTPSDTLVKKGDRYYTQSGEAVFVNFSYTNLSISAMLGTSPARYLELDDEGNAIVALDYYDALSAYAAMGNYPLTTDLVQMLEHLDIAKGWTDGGWLNGWQELCFLVKDHQGGEPVVEGNLANTYCTGCNKLLHSEEAKPKEPYAFGSQKLTVGTNTVTLNSGAVYTLNKFNPTETGVYTFEAPAGVKLAYYNTSFNPMDMTGDAAANTLEWTCSAVGQQMLLGVSGSGESVAVTITRTGDYVSQEIQYTIYENVHTPSKENADYCANVGGWFSVPQVVQVGDRFYGVTADGAYIPMFVDLAYTDLSLTTMLETSSAKYVQKDENGKIVLAYNYYDALKAYTAFGKYPLTVDLMRMLQHLDVAKGWTEGGWLEGWQELCFLASEHMAGLPEIDGDLAKYYCTGCGKLLKTEEAPQDGIIASGTYGKYNPVQWKITTDGWLVISGEGEMDENNDSYEVPNASWRDYVDQVTGIEVESGITSVSYNVFCHMTNVTQVVLAQTVENIATYAFYNCDGLEQFTIPTSARLVSAGAFLGCDNLKEFIREEATEYGYTDDGVLYTTHPYIGYAVEAYPQNRPGSSYTVPDGVNQIMYYAFSEAKHLKEIILPESLVVIQTHAFESSALTSVTIPAAVIRIEPYAFANSKLETVYFQGDAPTFRILGDMDPYSNFENVTATCYYPADNATWTADKLQNYGGNLTWIPYSEECLHPEVEHVEAVAATCMAEGNVEYWHCEDCGKFWTDEALTQAIEDVILPVAAHDLVHVKAVEATCMNEGNIEHWYCNVCEIVWQDEALTQVTNHKNVIVPAAEHDLVHVEAVAASCMAEGNIEHWYCNICEIVWQDEALTQVTNHKNVILPVADHDLVHVEAKEPTATEDGNIEHWYCNVCEVVWQDEALTQVTNHKNVILPALGEPEIPGNTPEEFILVEFAMNEDWTAGTASVTVEPGIWYYGAYIAGMELTANGESVELTPAQPRKPAIFCFTNEGTEAVTYELVASYPLGSMSNPAALTLGENVAPIQEGNDQGYFYTWTAEDSGTLTLTMPQSNWFYTLNNLTSGIYGDMQYSTSNPVVAAPRLEVNAGDQIQVIVNNYDPANPWTAPAGDLVFQASFEKAVLLPLALIPMIGEPAEVVKHSDGSYTVYLDKEDVAELPPFSIMSQTLEPIEKKDLKWTTSDSRIASVKSDAYSPIGNVTLKKGAEGACVITAQNVKTKDVASVTIVIRSYEPRLETASLSLNSNAHAGAQVALTESYGNAITGVTVHEYDSKTKGYAQEASQRLIPAYEDGILTVTHGQPMKKGSYKLLLKVSCANGETYEYPVTLKVTETLPTVTIKQLNKFNTFYTDSEAQFLITSKDGVIAGAELFFGENPAFQGEFDTETGILTVRYSEAYLKGETKLGVKGDIMVFFQGYWNPVEKATTISTEKKAPKVFLDAASSTINTALGEASVTLAAFYGELGNMTTLEDILKVDAGTFAEAEVTQPHERAEIKLTLTGKKGGTAKIYVQVENWTEPVTVSHKISVQTKQPGLKFDKKDLRLNNVLTDIRDMMEVSTDQGNVAVESITVEPVSKSEKVLAEIAKLRLDVMDDCISVSLDPENAPKKGTYEFKATAIVGEDTAITKNFKVVVEEKVPTVKAASATLKLNTQLGTKAYAETGITVSGLNGMYRLVDLVPEKENENFQVSYDPETGILRAALTNDEAKNGKHSVKLYPKLESSSGTEVVLSKAVTVNVQIFSGKPAVTVKATGKLDTIVPDSAIAYTITKLSNIAGVPEAVRLEGQGAELFRTELLENGALVKLNPDAVHQKDKTYKLKLVFTIDGMEVPAAVSVKVSQSSVKFAAVKTLNYYQGQSGRMALRLEMTAPAGASVGDITLGSQTAKQLLAALGEDAITWIPMTDGTCLVSIQVENPGQLTYGKSYNLFLDVTPAGNAENAKPTSLKITVKVAK